LHEGDLGPLGKNNTQIKKWLRSVWYFSLGYSFEVRYPRNIDVSNSCFVWSFLQTFDFSNRGLIIAGLDIERTVCNDTFDIGHGEDSLLWVSFLAIFLSVISFAGTWHYFYGMAGYLKKL